VWQTPVHVGSPMPVNGVLKEMTVLSDCANVLVVIAAPKSYVMVSAGMTAARQYRNSSNSLVLLAFTTQN